MRKKSTVGDKPTAARCSVFVRPPESNSSTTSEALSLNDNHQRKGYSSRWELLSRYYIGKPPLRPRFSFRLRVNGRTERVGLVFLSCCSLLILTWHPFLYVNKRVRLPLPRVHPNARYERNRSANQLKMDEISSPQIGRVQPLIARNQVAYELCEPSLKTSHMQ